MERRKFNVDTLLIDNIHRIQRVRVTVDPALANDLSADMPGIISLNEDDLATQKVRVFLCDLDPLYPTPENAISDLTEHLRVLSSKDAAPLYDALVDGDVREQQTIPQEV